MPDAAPGLDAAQQHQLLLQQVILLLPAQRRAPRLALCGTTLICDACLSTKLPCRCNHSTSRAKAEQSSAALLIDAHFSIHWALCRRTHFVAMAAAGAVRGGAAAASDAAGGSGGASGSRGAASCLIWHPAALSISASCTLRQCAANNDVPMWRWPQAAPLYRIVCPSCIVSPAQAYPKALSDAAEV